MPESAAAHALLVKVQADIADIDKVINGLSKLSAASTSLTTGSAAKIGAWGAGFTQVFSDIQAAALKTGEVLFQFIEGFIDKAAEIQTEEFPLIMMLRENQEVAKEVLEGISSAWQRIGVISNESLSRAARSLLLMNVPAENLISRLQDLAKVAVATGENVDQVAGAYQRVRQAIEKETAPAVRGVGAFGLSTLAIFQALEEHFGKLAGTTRLAEGQIVAMFQGGKISIDDLNKSLAEAGATGGRFADVFEQKKATFGGAVQAMQTAWQGLQVELGKPLIDFLTPIINRLTVFQQRLVAVSQEVGWKDALKAAWTVVMEELLVIADKVLLPGMEKVGAHMAETLGLGFAKFLSIHFPDISGAIVKMLIPDIPADVSGRQANQVMKDFLKAMATPDTTAVDAAQKKFREVLKGIMGSGSWVTDMADQIWFDFLAHPPPMPMAPPIEEETHRADTAKQLSAALHELELAMNGIRQENALISGSPFLGVDQKQVALIANVEKQMENLQQELVKLKALKDVLPLNDPQMAQLQVKIQTAENEFKKLGQQLLGITHPLQAELQSWANSFGSTAHQIGATIEGTINASLQSLNQFLVTGKFNAQALLQQIILLGLQLIEQLAIQQVMRMINRTAAITEAETVGPVIAAALAPAVTAQTIASAGAEAVAAPFEVAAAVAGVLGVLSAHEGGLMTRRRFHSGGLAADEVPIIAQEGEIMIQRGVAQQPGMADFLLGLNAGMYHSGGFIWGERYHGGTDFGGNEIDPFGRGDRFIHMPSPGGGTPFYNPPDLPPTSPGPRDLTQPPFTTGDIDRSYKTSPFYDPEFSNILPIGFLTGYGNVPSPAWGAPAFGPTQTPTFWVNYPGVGNVPMAVPIGGWQVPDTGIVGQGTPQKKATHSGGLITRFHSGGSVGKVPMAVPIGGWQVPFSGLIRQGTPPMQGKHQVGSITRFHSGGSVGGGVSSGGGVSRGGGVHIYAFTDLKQLTRHMASKDGQKIIFDTVKGRRIDLGIS